jgi:hypothetical protein
LDSSSLIHQKEAVAVVVVVEAVVVEVVVVAAIAVVTAVVEVVAAIAVVAMVAVVAAASVQLVSGNSDTKSFQARQDSGTGLAIGFFGIVEIVVEMVVGKSLLTF